MARSFQFIDFEPTQRLKKIASTCLQKALQRLESESPSDAFAKYSIRRTLEGFETSLQLNSAVGTFAVKVLAQDPEEAINQVVQKMRSQLRVWKRFRFL